jgi:transposase InsO family protein
VPGGTDTEQLGPLRTLVDERPTYGYRRIGALLNRERPKSSLPRLNHERIYRLMSQSGSLLQRYTGKSPGRAHEGQIITIRPSLHWISDGLEIACWSGEVVRVAFALDTCDRVIMAWCAFAGGISYRADETIDFAISLGLVPCFMPVRSPQSNGVAEAFVKAFKRDNVHVHDRSAASICAAHGVRFIRRRGSRLAGAGMFRVPPGA